MRHPGNFESSQYEWTGEEEVLSLPELYEIADELNAEEEQQEAPRGPAHAKALARVIPDDPNYQKYVPINYRLDAKKVIGAVAQDISTLGQSIHHWVDGIHWGLFGAELAAEALAEAGILAKTLAVAGPGISLAGTAGGALLGLVGVGLALGTPYAEAAQKIAANWSASGFSRGVLMGADRRPARLVVDYFQNDYFPPNPQFPRGQAIARANYRMGLVVGYLNGRALSKNQRAIFFRDLGRRLGDQSHRGPQKQWNRKQWIDWYVTAAAVFRRDHL